MTVDVVCEAGEAGAEDRGLAATVAMIREAGEAETEAEDRELAVIVESEREAVELATEDRGLSISTTRADARDVVRVETTISRLGTGTSEGRICTLSTRLALAAAALLAVDAMNVKWLCIIAAQLHTILSIWL